MLEREIQSSTYHLIIYHIEFILRILISTKAVYSIKPPIFNI
ncbi:hypothetical protein XIS1_90006 [Xenorhabdus innexi]|uniref:Uncharacterized protein n=1 Tax=Xenorhabdus innexi TaxID=290109 RepID=A0A1N6N1K6_9GAMM|nr:hypothetical protein XIS1_90006 [Xenorhabdus innexi]